MKGARKRCWVAWAAAETSHLLELEVAAEATVAQVLAAARALTGDAAVPWESAPVGIFGELCLRSTRPRDGDRIELYRPLKNDPKEARRLRARPRGGG